ncbi:MAG: Ig-like domain-containing protein [Eubacterium sp.]|nr:Ig-like domain-containing protein [Eubacterium sp.]
MKQRIRRIVATFAILLCMSMLIGTNASAAMAPRMNLKKLNLTKGDDFTLRVYNLSEDESVNFKTTDDSVVKIASIGANQRSCVIVGKTVGKATIKAIIKKAGKVTDTLKCKINVTPVPVSIKFTDSTTTLKEGQQAYVDVIIKPYSATEQPIFETSNENVAVVNAKGKVTAVSPGRAVITATLLSTGKKAKCTIIVKEDPDDD